MGRVQAAMQDAMDYANTMRAVAEAVAAARAKAGEAAAKAAGMALQASAFRGLHEPLRKTKPPPPNPPMTEAQEQIHQSDPPRTVIAKVVGWEAKSKGSSPFSPLLQVPQTRAPSTAGPSAARIVVRVRRLPPGAFDRAIRALRAPVADAAALQSDPTTAALAEGGPPALAFFDGGATIFVFHAGIWYYREGTVFTQEIQDSIFHEAEIEHLN